MKISISALSIAYGLTPEALRYYEEKGLLTPDRTASSGFRRFSMEDVQIVGIIKSLQRQGFSLDEIRRIITGCAHDELIDMMDEKRTQLREQLAFSRAIYDRLSAATDLLRDSERLVMRPRLCGGCAAYLLDFASVPDLWASVPKSPLLRELIDSLPLANYCTVVPLACLHGEDVPLRAGVAAPAEYAAVIRADFSQLRMSAGPRTVRVLMELRPPKNASVKPALLAAMAFVKEKGLTPVSDGYTRQYSWSADEKGQRRQFSEMIIPVAQG